MSGARSVSQAVRFSIRCLTELTFQVAMRMGFFRSSVERPTLTNMPDFLERPKGIEADPACRCSSLTTEVQAGAPMCYRTLENWGETGPSRHGGIGECG